MQRQIMERFWEVDFLRGIAIILMVVYHFLFDLDYFKGYGVNLESGLWWLVGRAAAILFIFLVGVSLALSYSRYRLNTGAAASPPYKKYFFRGLKIFSWGLIITLLTYIFFRDEFIMFGVLHLIGVSIIISMFLLRPANESKKANLMLLMIGAAIIIAGICLINFRFDFGWLMWLGLRPYNLYTLDYFPLLPWLGLVLAGISLGNMAYRNYSRQFYPKLGVGEPKNIGARALCFAGRNSLIIYLIHQPVLIALLYIVG